MFDFGNDMKLLINGEQKEIQGQTSLQGLLSGYGINPKTVVVEHNENVIARNYLAEVDLKEGDKIEIVHFVGGGSPRASKAGLKAFSTVAASNGPKNLVIVESPAKAKTINKYLGSDFHVEASLGHVRDLPKSKMGIDIQNNFQPQYIIIRKATKTVKHLKQLAKGKTGIFLAPDPDREGEAISWHLAHIFKEENGSAAIHRVVFNEITKEAVKEAFKHPREIMMNLVNAQQARRILDRILGYELSPLLWKKVGSGLSAGRVQSVALRLIVDREKEIRSFVPLEYWSLIAKLSSEKGDTAGKIFEAKLDKIRGEKAEIKNKDQAEKLRETISKLPFHIAKIEIKERTRRPQAPYTTSKLQQEAYTRLGFSASKTMKIAQGLYEGVEIGEEGSVGLITYMRTDSVAVSASAQAESVKYIKERFGNDYLPKETPVYKSKKGAQEAHEAVRPTSAYRDPKSIQSYLDADQYKLYELIWKKFLASQMSPALDESMSVIIKAGEDFDFKSTGKRNIFPGFTAVFEDFNPKEKEEAKNSKEGEDEEELPYGELPKLTEQEILRLHELLADQHFTKPPARFNDASLVKTLEEKGIGRPSTYAPTIYTLVSREYVNRKGGALIPTELGEIVADLLVKHFPKILDEQFTARMEEELDKIEEGDMEWVHVVRDFYEPFQGALVVAREEMKNVKREVIPTDYKCDVCGKPMVLRWGRFGKFLACSAYPECKFTRSVPTGYRCPQAGCGGDIVKRTSKKRRIFYGCSNYPKCTYITNQLPKQETVSEDEKLPEGEMQSP